MQDGVAASDAGVRAVREEENTALEEGGAGGTGGCGQQPELQVQTKTRGAQKAQAYAFTGSCWQGCNPPGLSS